MKCLTLTTAQINTKTTKKFFFKLSLISKFCRNIKFINIIVITKYPAPNRYNGNLKNQTINNIKFTKCNHFSDNNHIVSTDFYKKNLLPKLKKMSFPEYSLRCHPVVENDYSFYYLGDINDGNYIRHIDGRCKRNKNCDIVPDQHRSQIARAVLSSLHPSQTWGSWNAKMAAKSTSQP